MEKYKNQAVIYLFIKKPLPKGRGFCLFIFEDKPVGILKAYTL